jgi:hypothetical protein
MTLDPEQRRRRWRVGFIALVVVALTFVLGLAKGNSPPKNFSVNSGFGGYNLQGSVTEISAEIRVGTVSSVSGDASSWVGLQQGHNIPFIQVGVARRWPFSGF